MNLYRVKLPLYRRAKVGELIALDDSEVDRLLRIDAVELAQDDEQSLSAMCDAIAAAATAEGIVDTWSAPIPAGAELPRVAQVAPAESATEGAVSPASGTATAKPAKAPRKPAKAK